jgi:hypothetical protein
MIIALASPRVASSVEAGLDKIERSLAYSVATILGMDGRRRGAPRSSFTRTAREATRRDPI